MDITQCSETVLGKKYSGKIKIVLQPKQHHTVLYHSHEIKLFMKLKHANVRS